MHRNTGSWDLYTYGVHSLRFSMLSMVIYYTNPAAGGFARSDIDIEVEEFILFEITSLEMPKM